jgi:hypothetical protein
MRFGLNVDAGGGEKVYYPLNWLNAIWLQNNVILMKKRWICFKGTSKNSMCPSLLEKGEGLR